MEDSSDDISPKEFFPYVKTVIDAIRNEFSDRDVGMYIVALCSVYKVLLRFSKDNNIDISEEGVEAWSDLISQNVQMIPRKPPEDLK